MPDRPETEATMNDTLDAVLPLTEKDLPRFTGILMPTLDRFFVGLGTCWIVVPDAQVHRVRQVVRTPRYEVVAETELLPELAWSARLRAYPSKRGWFVQQLIKLAIAERVRSPYYVTLDADVICVRPTAHEDLVIDGRGLCQLDDADHHANWTRWSRRVLQLPAPARPYNVTPAVLSRAAVLELGQHLMARSSAFWRFVGGWFPEGAAGRRFGTHWTGQLLRKLPWTEYTLYFGYLDATDRFARHHALLPDRAIHGNDVWFGEDFATWDPSVSFRSDAPFHFSVVQGWTGIPVAEVAARVRPFLTSSVPIEAGGSPGDEPGHAT